MWHRTQYIKRREEWRGGMFTVTAFVFPSNRYVWWSPALLGWLNSCLLMGSSEQIPCSALLAHTAFALPIKLSLSRPMRFLTSALLILSPSHRNGDWASSCLVLSCRLEFNHNTYMQFASNSPLSKFGMGWKNSLTTPF